LSDFLTIVRAVYSGLSQRKVAATHGVSRNTVSLYLRKARDQGWLTLKDLDALDDTAVTQGLLQITAPSRDATFKPGFPATPNENAGLAAINPVTIEL